MSVWSATKAKRVYAALLRAGWTLKKQVGSHRKLQRSGLPNFTFVFTITKKWDRRLLRRSGKRQVSGRRIFEDDSPLIGWRVRNGLTSFVVGYATAMRLGLACLYLLTATQVFAQAASLSESNEIRIGHMLAEKFIKLRGLFR